VAAAVAAYTQARAIVAEQRAALFPSVTLDASGDRSGSRGGGTTVSSNGTVTQAGHIANNYRLTLGTSWEPDVWGRLRAGVSAAQANAEASAADLASARLSAQGELAADYFSLRSVDAQRALLATTIEGYERLLKITQNRFDVGIVPHSDLYQAETQLATASTRSRCWSGRRRPTSRWRQYSRADSRRRRPPCSCRTCRSVCRPRCCSAVRTSPPPSARWPPPTRRSASRAPPTTRTSA
jgi:hypothetical protein